MELSNLIAFFKMLKKIGSDDPRRIVHALKVGLGLTLVSVFYYVNPVFQGLGQPVMWAVLTVILVMEFTVGAAISKGLNRACATFLAGALGVGAHRLAILFGEKGEPIVLGVLVFLVAALATFARFIPKLKARYDYGVVIFILTFCMVTVSSYREDKVLMLAKERICTISIGVLISFFVSILVFPVWAGEDLHRLAASNLEKLGRTMQSIGEEAVELGNKSSFLGGHKGVLHSKSTEDSLANFAWWEPPHRGFWFRHPWGQYLKLGEESQRCAYLMEALNTYIQTSNKVDYFEFDKKLLVACTEMSTESCKALREVASAIRTMKTPSAATNQCIDKAKIASEEMKSSLLERGRELKLQVLYTAPIVSILIELFICTQAIVESVEELAKRAHFTSSEEASKAAAKTVTTVMEGFDHVAIEVGE